MEKLYVNLGENSYNISFHADFDKLPEVLEEVNAPKKLMIVTDSNVEKLYAREVLSLLQKTGYDVACYAFEAGEEHKTPETVLDICRACMEHKLDRKSMIVALGGGVVGDMAGFAAAIYMRGISFVQVPTTLLSQSDSSVGGKTGVDFGGAKNIIGAFLQPKHVYINVSTVRTLPEREIISGMGEVIKHGIIRDSEFFAFLSDNVEGVKELDTDTLIHMSKTNCSIKANVVEADEKENGVRAHLNFGHTIGHAIESASDYTLTHGECVGLGMAAAAYIAKERGLINNTGFTSIIALLDKYGFNLKTKLEDYDKILSLMLSDKKTIGGKLRFVLPVAIGAVDIFDDITEGEIISALEFIKSEE
ncbi:MAG: 3-dehydroquinate synthase [Clostridia bacterium]|nr:3-dehydroquinate synthase [Clostridia bacterium]